MDLLSLDGLEMENTGRTTPIDMSVSYKAAWYSSLSSNILALGRKEVVSQPRHKVPPMLAKKQVSVKEWQALWDSYVGSVVEGFNLCWVLTLGLSCFLVLPFLIFIPMEIFRRQKTRRSVEAMVERVNRERILRDRGLQCVITGSRFAGPTIRFQENGPRPTNPNSSNSKEVLYDEEEPAPSVYDNQPWKARELVEPLDFNFEMLSV